MNDRSKIWVSELNSRPEIRSAFAGKTIRFYDTTLRDGEQTVGVVLSPQQKVEIARKLDELGVSRIEAGFPKVSPEDAEAIQLMQKADIEAELWGFSRAVRGDLEELVRLGLRASVVESPTSDIKLKAYGMTRDEVLKRVTEAISFARKNGIATAYFAVDGTRTELEFLKKIYLAALDAGAAEIVVVDTIGACGPEAAAFLVAEVCRWVGPNVPVHWHGHDDFGMATACAVAAVRAGATWIQGTINGMGERAGNADISEIALALRCLYGVDVALDLSKAREASAAVSGASGYTLDAWKPLVGENLFMRESGAVASQFHMPEAIEPYSAELVSARRSIVLGKKSGLDSIDLKCKELGLTIQPEQRGAILAEVKKMAVRKRGLLTDDEFRDLTGSGEIEFMDRLAMLGEILTQNPNDAFARYGLAMEYSKSGDSDRAMEEFGKLLTAHPDYTAGYFMAAQTLVAANRRDEARKMLVEGISSAVRTGNSHAQAEMTALMDELK